MFKFLVFRQAQAFLGEWCKTEPDDRIRQSFYNALDAGDPVVAFRDPLPSDLRAVDSKSVGIPNDQADDFDAQHVFVPG